MYVGPATTCKPVSPQQETANAFSLESITSPLCCCGLPLPPSFYARKCQPPSESLLLLSKLSINNRPGLNLYQTYSPSEIYESHRPKARGIQLGPERVAGLRTVSNMFFWFTDTCYFHGCVLQQQHDPCSGCRQTVGTH